MVSDVINIKSVFCKMFHIKSIDAQQIVITTQMHKLKANQSDMFKTLFKMSEMIANDCEC